MRLDNKLLAGLSYIRRAVSRYNEAEALMSNKLNLSLTKRHVKLYSIKQVERYSNKSKTMKVTILKFSAPQLRRLTIDKADSLIITIEKLCKL